MTVLPLPGAGADAPLPQAGAPGAGFGAALRRAFDGAEEALTGADAAERAFASGHGGLAEMVVARARADVALALATAAASRVTQGLGTLLGMQI
jgi:flagellar hook-basal body complex protein FliE